MSEPMTNEVRQDQLLRELLLRRKAVRAFTPQPVPREIIVDALRDAAQAPSNCNTQPWEVHVVGGEALERLGNAMLARFERGENNPDFSWDAFLYTGELGERRAQQGAIYYGTLGVDRADKEGRMRAIAQNFRFFGAPHAAFVFMPEIGDSVRVAGDVGMFTQSFLLALTARGVASVPQTVLSYFPDTVRDALGMPPEKKLLLGISFGYPVDGHPANDTNLPRETDSYFVFHDF